MTLPQTSTANPYLGGSVTFSYNLVGEANITVNRNRVKLYGLNVYLKDSQEFEIELFNPSANTKLAKIYLNGKIISTGGLVLKPGQRVYLERFIDTPKKFKFETYEHDNSPEALNAIAQNGDVKVEFYDEQVPQIVHQTYPRYTYNSSTGGTINCSNTFTTANAFVSGPTKRNLATQDSFQTGRVEQGSNSSQKFENYNGKFNSYVSNTVYLKILPISQKPAEIQELAQYCTECGTRNKKGNYKYCPTCGNKFN